MRRASSAHELTPLLRAWSEGNGQSLDHLKPLTYSERQRIAHGFVVPERSNRTTTLVNRAYVRLVGDQFAGRQSSTERETAEVPGIFSNVVQWDWRLFPGGRFISD